MKYLFALGLLLQICGQSMFTIHAHWITLQEPIDFIHWALLLGYMMCIPYALQFSLGWFRSVGSVLTFLGAVSLVGMCAIDFVFWSYRSDYDSQTALVSKMMAEPAIWPVFFTVGPAFFFTGLAVQAMGFWQSHRVATIAAVMGSIAVGLGGLIFPDIRIIYMAGYVVFALGLLAIVFDRIGLPGSQMATA